MGRRDQESGLSDWGICRRSEGSTCRRLKYTGSERVGHDLADEFKADRASLLVLRRLVELLTVLGRMNAIVDRIFMSM